MYFGNPESYEWYGKRCLLYIRVSTEEQARQGYSLAAQLEELEAFAKQFCMKVVGVFTDDGVTARKEVHKRKGLSNLLESVKQGVAEYVLFIKLDRWFRSVREYYRVQDILDEHNVNWKAILEDYDTTTTNGRLNLNIRLSIAQDESDRTGDRIRFVNDNRVKHGGAITGAYPMGLYSMGGKNGGEQKDGRVHINEQEAEIVRAIFECYAENGAVRPCVDRAMALTGQNVAYKTIKAMLTNKLYIGEYRDNPGYCQAIVDVQLFDTVQQMLAAKVNVRERKHEYVFSGLVRCPECGRKMVSWCQRDYKFGRDYYRYRCNRKYLDKACGNGFTPWENRIEKYLLSNIRKRMEDYLLGNEVMTKKEAPAKSNLDAIRRRLMRLQALYLEELIDLDAYREEYARLSGMIAEAKKPEHIENQGVDKIKSILETDFEAMYSTFTVREKNIFWSSFIKHIDAHNKDKFSVVFL